jgi:hypothetical protein
MTTTQQPAETFETYRNGLVRPVAMKNLPDWALSEFLGRHHGPALAAAQDEAEHRGWIA